LGLGAQRQAQVALGGVEERRLHGAARVLDAADEPIVADAVAPESG